MLYRRWKWAYRSRPAEEGFKPPGAAASKGVVVNQAIYGVTTMCLHLPHRLAGGSFGILTLTLCATLLSELVRFAIINFRAAGTVHMRVTHWIRSTAYSVGGACGSIPATIFPPFHVTDTGAWWVKNRAGNSSVSLACKARGATGLLR